MLPLVFLASKKWQQAATTLLAIILATTVGTIVVAFAMYMLGIAMAANHGSTTLQSKTNATTPVIIVIMHSNATLILLIGTVYFIMPVAK